MNTERILALADAIEAGRDDLGFNMRYYFAKDTAQDKSGHSCGTTACIAGWAKFLESGSADWASRESAAKWLDLDFVTSYKLTQEGFNADNKQAARTLRHLAKTGFVNWDLEP